MPPKGKEVSKADAKAMAAKAADKTFGLKNKNKSKAVQQYIKQVNQNVRQVTGQDKRDAEKKVIATIFRLAKSIFVTFVILFQTKFKLKFQISN